MASKPNCNDIPQLFRLNIEVAGLSAAIDFYSALLGLEGRKQAGSRCYFVCGPVTLQVLDVAASERGNVPREPHTAAKSLYFTVSDLDAIYARAKSLDCLSTESVHGSPGGGIVVRPWGERSFHAEDPWKNSLCFVDETTVYEG